MRSVDLVVVEVGSRRAGRTVAALREVMEVGAVWAPGQHAVVGAMRRLEPAALTVAGGRLSIVPEASGRRFDIRLDP